MLCQSTSTFHSQKNPEIHLKESIPLSEDIDIPLLEDRECIQEEPRLSKFTQLLKEDDLQILTITSYHE